MSTFVLVPGACQGGWWYDPPVDGLQDQGHRAQTLTLAGLGPEGMTGAGQVNLAGHVDQVADAVALAAEPPASRWCWSGTATAAASSPAPPTAPRNRSARWSMTNDEQRSWYIQGAGRDGLTVDPLPFFDQRARPHPLATLLQCARLTGAWTRVPAKTYIAATGWPGGLAASPFAPTAARLAVDPT